MLKPFLIIPVVCGYFFVSWFSPWQNLAPGSTISAAYLFDLIFILTVMILRKKMVLVGNFKPSLLIVRSIIVIVFGVICTGIVKFTGMQAPFKYVDHLFLQMIILAPFIEELVYRESMFELQKKLGSSNRQILIMNSAIFSISHYSGVFLLPAEFHNFIYLQMLYTFPLGWLCTKAKLRSGGILEPITLHLIFNIVFYIAVIKYGM